jgi:hypothetical protein
MNHEQDDQLGTTQDASPDIAERVAADRQPGDPAAEAPPSADAATDGPAAVGQASAAVGQASAAVGKASAAVADPKPRRFAIPSGKQLEHLGNAIIGEIQAVLGATVKKLTTQHQAVISAAVTDAIRLQFTPPGKKSDALRTAIDARLKSVKVTAKVLTAARLNQITAIVLKRLSAFVLP